MENTQVIDNLMSDLLDIIEKENLNNGCIQQKLKTSQDTESLLFPEVKSPILTAPKKNNMDSSPKIDNLIAEISATLTIHQLIWSNLKNVSLMFYQQNNVNLLKVELTSSLNVLN